MQPEAIVYALTQYAARAFLPVYYNDVPGRRFPLPLSPPQAPQGGAHYCHIRSHLSSFVRP
jgi:hypothetical protein